MKDILISVQPKNIEKIAKGECTILVRKTRPKLEPPFKCYIYCTKTTKNGEHLIIDKKSGYAGFYDYRNAFNHNADGYVDCYIGEGEVVGEFICDRIDTYYYSFRWNSNGYLIDNKQLKQTGLSFSEFQNCGGNGKTLYGWHISDLKIYDKPVALEYYGKPCKSAHYEDYFGCWYCEEWECSDCGFLCPISSGGESDDYEDGGYCMGYGRQPRFQPPSDWCYVEDIENDEKRI